MKCVHLWAKIGEKIKLAHLQYRVWIQTGSRITEKWQLKCGPFHFCGPKIYAKFNYFWCNAQLKTMITTLDPLVATWVFVLSWISLKKYRFSALFYLSFSRDRLRFKCLATGIRTYKWKKWQPDQVSRGWQETMEVHLCQWNYFSRLCPEWLSFETFRGT